MHEVNRAHLKDRLLNHYPDLHVQNDGHDILLAFEDIIGIALAKACSASVDRMHYI